MFSLFAGSPLPPGTPAPDFTLLDQDGNEVTLSALRGKNVVLIFYPSDNTPVCTRQLCEFRDEAALVASRDTVVFGVNPSGPRRHSGFRDKHGFPFPLLVDDSAKVAKLYNASGPLWIVRTVYLIGKDGLIRYAQRGKPAPEEVLAAAV